MIDIFSCIYGQLFLLLYYYLSMKIDNRDKEERIRRFLGDIKCRPHIEPFLNMEELTRFGIYDFYYINKNPPTFTSIEKKLKDHKYDEIK